MSEWSIDVEATIESKGGETKKKVKKQRKKVDNKNNLTNTLQGTYRGHVLLSIVRDKRGK